MEQSSERYARAHECGTGIYAATTSMIAGSGTVAQVLQRLYEICPQAAEPLLDA